MHSRVSFVQCTKQTLYNAHLENMMTATNQFKLQMLRDTGQLHNLPLILCHDIVL